MPWVMPQLPKKLVSCASLNVCALPSDNPMVPELTWTPPPQPLRHTFVRMLPCMLSSHELPAC